MRKYVIILFFFITSAYNAFAQLNAGDIPPGKNSIFPNIRLAIYQYKLDSVSVDLDCDGNKDLRFNLRKGPTSIDGPNDLTITALNPTLEICADTTSAYRGWGKKVTLYKKGDALNCSGNNQWYTKTTPLAISVWGCMMCQGYPIVDTSNVYLSYKMNGNSNAGWLKFSYDIVAYTNDTVTLSIDEYVCYTDIISVNENRENILINIFPNPFTDQVRFEVSGVEGKILSLFIHDVLGRVVKKLDKITTPEFTIDRLGMENGIYYYELKTEDRIIGRGKLVIR